MSSITHNVADDILVRCARHCCICRRFRPLLLQVHHIHERAQGGSDEPDNLIATCISCHAEIHTETRLTRRFTEDELKKHRDEVYRLVADGKLPQLDDHDDRIDQLTRALVDLFTVRVPVAAAPPISLIPEAMEILLAASSEYGHIEASEYDGGFAVIAGAKQFDFQGNPRKTAALRRAVQQLATEGFIEGDGKAYFVSYDGYQFADNLLSASSRSSGGKQA